MCLLEIMPGSTRTARILREFTYTYMEISGRISNSTPLILMVNISFSLSMRVYMKAFGVFTVATSRFSSASIMHVSRADSVVNVGEITYSLYIKYFFLLLPATVLPFMVPSLLYLREMWDSRIVLLCSLVKSFSCRGMNVSFIWSCFISEWNFPLPFLPTS